MYDYDVWYNGQVIGNVKADNDRAAKKLATQIYGTQTAVTRTH